MAMSNFQRRRARGAHCSTTREGAGNRRAYGETTDRGQPTPCDAKTCPRRAAPRHALRETSQDEWTGFFVGRPRGALRSADCVSRDARRDIRKIRAMSLTTANLHLESTIIKSETNTALNESLWLSTVSAMGDCLCIAQDNALLAAERPSRQD